MAIAEQGAFTPKIQVLVRKRPLTNKEESRSEIDIVRVLDEQSLILLEEKEKLDTSKYTEEHRYHFDCIFDEKTSNYQIYDKKIRPLVAAALNNTHVSCFAYGQTGSGKTFTMMGTNPKSKSDGGVPGLYLLAANDIFTLREQLGLRHVSVGVSLFEIYMEKAYDLLNNRKECPVRVDEKNVVHIVGLSEQEIGNVDQLMNIIDFGQNCRITGKTSANEHSSRSHAILQIVFRNNQTRKSCGKMSFIDLAGNERAADTNSSNKQTMSDGAGINQSLLALKECIRDLDSGKDLVRFRSSKLTMVLKDSFVGNTKTIMFANISPVQSSCEQTMNTLRYADRVKELKNPNRRRTDTSVDLADNLMLARNNGLSTNGSKKLSVTSKMPGGHSQGEPMTATALLNMHQTQYNQQMAGLPVESENFGFKPTQSRPNFPTDSHMKINKRVSTPVEVSKSSRTMGGQGYGIGNLTKPSGMMENGIPVLTNNTNQILGQNQHYSTEADWRRDHQSTQNTGFGPSHLQNQQYGAGNLKPSSQKSSLVGKVPGKPAGGASALLQNYLGEQMNGSQSTAIMEPENHHNGMSVEGFPAEASEESENRAPDFGTDPLRAAREKKFAQKRTQPPSKQVGSATGSEYDHLDLPALKRAHSDIIKQILQEEDIIISQHKDALDLKVSKVKHEMSLLSSFEKGECAYPEYIEKMKDHIATHLQIEQTMLSLIQVFEEKVLKEQMLKSKLQARESTESMGEMFKDNLLNGLD